MYLISMYIKTDEILHKFSKVTCGNVKKSAELIYFDGYAY